MNGIMRKHQQREGEHGRASGRAQPERCSFFLRYLCIITGVFKAGCEGQQNDMRLPGADIGFCSMGRRMGSIVPRCRSMRRVVKGMCGNETDVSEHHKSRAAIDREREVAPRFGKTIGIFFRAPFMLPRWHKLGPFNGKLAPNAVPLSIAVNGAANEFSQHVGIPAGNWLRVFIQPFAHMPYIIRLSFEGQCGSPCV
jgi:hypothetical protein